MSIQPFSYASTPKGYACNCGAKNCKLWRQPNTLASHIELLCATCAMKDQRTGPLNLDAKGRHKTTAIGMNDQIGWLVPAVPTEDGTTFWGYSSVPDAGVDWWQFLPNHSKEKK